MLINKAWKYSFGSFIFYGLLFLAYGELSCLFMNLRYFKSELSCGIGIMIGVIFAVMLVVWIIGLAKLYSNWFGSFKKKFYRF